MSSAQHGRVSGVSNNSGYKDQENVGKIASKLGWQNEENTHVVLDAIGIHKLVGENYENSSQVKFDAGDDIKNRLVKT